MTTIKPILIPGVELKQLQTHRDERGFLREIIRSSDSFFNCFGQLVHSVRDEGYVDTKFHIHQRQVDYFYVPVGEVEMILCDLRGIPLLGPGRLLQTIGTWEGLEFHKFLLGENHPQVLRIPKGVAHLPNVWEGPAHMIYVISNEYDGTDEGRIELPYEWE